MTHSYSFLQKHFNTDRPYRKEAYGGKHYTLRADQVLLRKGKPKRKPMTDEQRAELRRRLRIDVKRPMGLETEQHHPTNQGE
jgi:hypothetical protein